MNKKIIFSFFSLALLVLFAPVLHAQSAKVSIKPAKFERLMKKKNTVVVDVRTADEFNSGHIPGAINIDVKGEGFLQQIKSLDHTKKYLLYCRSGKRSETALNLMRANGFSNTLHLKGGIEAWKNHSNKK